MTSLDEELKRIPKHPEEVINQGHDYAELLRIARRNEPKNYPRPSRGSFINRERKEKIKIVTLPEEENL